MSPYRPDLVECFVFRVPENDPDPEFLLVRRAAGHIFAGLWQPVTGGLGPDETVPACALREVAEEVGFAWDDIVGFYDLEQVIQFYDQGSDAIATSVIFAARVGADAQPRLSVEHDAYRWATADNALDLAIWPPYEESITRIGEKLLDPASARWFELDPAGRRLAR